MTFYSTLTAAPIDTTGLDTGYWVTNLREPVRFADTIQALLDDGHRTFIEASPHPVLTLGMQETFDQTGFNATALATLRRDQGDQIQIAHALAHAHTTGTHLDWAPCFPTTPTTTDLPTYAFQRKRYWLETHGGPGGDPASLGLTSAGHPLLGAAVEQAEGESHLLTGRLSLRTQAWMGDHRVLGAALFPGTAFAELAMHAAAQVGCDHVAELIVHDPLIVPDDGAVDLRIAVAAPDETGQRPLTIHSRPAADAGEPTWTRHATGVLATAPAATGPTALDGVWPPSGATPLTTRHLYDDLADLGSSYGAAFQGLAAAWRLDDHIYADVILPEAERAGATDYGVHPVLLDAALQACALEADAAAGDTDKILLPFSWSGLRLHSTGASALRIRITPTAASRISLTAADPTGAPVLTLEDLTLRPVQTERLDQARLATKSSMFRLTWMPLPASAAAPAARLAVVAPDADPTAGALVAALQGAEDIPTSPPCVPRRRPERRTRTSSSSR